MIIIFIHTRGSPTKLQHITAMTTNQFTLATKQSYHGYHNEISMFEKNN